MNVISDGCVCAKCLLKHQCKDCGMVIAIQKLADKFLVFGNEGIDVLIQIEYCPNRIIRQEMKK